MVMLTGWTGRNIMDSHSSTDIRLGDTVPYWDGAWGMRQELPRHHKIRRANSMEPRSSAHDGTSPSKSSPQVSPSWVGF